MTKSGAVVAPKLRVLATECAAGAASFVRAGDIHHPQVGDCLETGVWVVTVSAF